MMADEEGASPISHDNGDGRLTANAAFDELDHDRTMPPASCSAIRRVPATWR
jgi:hypothetical protein